MTLPPDTDQYRSPDGLPVLRTTEGELGIDSDFAPEPQSQWKLFRRRFFRHRVAVIALIKWLV